MSTAIVEMQNPNDSSWTASSFDFGKTMARGKDNGWTALVAFVVEWRGVVFHGGLGVDEVGAVLSRRSVDGEVSFVMVLDRISILPLIVLLASRSKPIGI